MLGVSRQSDKFPDFGPSGITSRRRNNVLLTGDDSSFAGKLESFAALEQASSEARGQSSLHLAPKITIYWSRLKI